MSRAALLSTCGDPFILLAGIKLFQRSWHQEIDRLYINYNNHAKIPAYVVGDCLKELVTDPRIHIIYHSEGIGNGPPITELLKLSSEDNILLLEDDFYIFQSGIVDGYFKKIESGETDLLGSARYTYGEVAQAAEKKYNLDYRGEGDIGFGWWPTGFYCKRSDLLKTDLDFGSKKYSKGEYFKELDHTFSEDSYTDTFTWASLQLRYMGLRDINIPQYHASPFEIEEYNEKKYKWSQPIGYIHGGSLSAGYGGYLSGIIPDVSHDIAKQEIETRAAFWELTSDFVEGFDNFKIEYKQGIKKLIENAFLSRERIDKKIKIYKNLMDL